MSLSLYIYIYIYIYIEILCINTYTYIYIGMHLHMLPACTSDSLAATFKSLKGDFLVGSPFSDPPFGDGKTSRRAL